MFKWTLTPFLRDFRPRVMQIDKHGQLLWSYKGDFDIKARSSTKLIGKGNDHWLLTRVYSENEKREANFKVGIVKFRS